MDEIIDPAERRKLYAALTARDYRFDGSFFVGVTTTGIYCRPICPARPLEANCRFFRSALAAEAAGFRPCLRCRPEAAPLSPAWYGTGAIVGRAIRYIEDFGLGEEGEEAFAARFGVGPRHLRRLFAAAIGKTPRRLYEDRRLDLARGMLAESALPVTEIAFASGYRSIRRFNAAFQARFARPPGAYRASVAGSAAVEGAACAAARPALTLSLAYRPPYDWEGMLAWLGRHALPGIEEVEDGAYRRWFPRGDGLGSVLVEPDPLKPALRASFDRFDRASLYPAIRGLRRLFDLDADPLLVSVAFEASPPLAALDAAYPGMRAPGAFDPFETAVAVILGQVVSTERARSLAGALVEAHGRPFETEAGRRYAFPAPDVLAEASLAALRVPEARRESVRRLSALVASGELALHPHQDPEAARRKLLAIPGIGPWTAEYILMRCLSDPDRWPATDLVLGRILAELGASLRPEELRPWRSYAVHRLLRGRARVPPAGKRPEESP